MGPFLESFASLAPGAGCARSTAAQPVLLEERGELAERALRAQHMAHVRLRLRLRLPPQEGAGGGRGREAFASRRLRVGGARRERRGRAALELQQLRRHSERLTHLLLLLASCACALRCGRHLRWLLRARLIEGGLGSSRERLWRSLSFRVKNSGGGSRRVGRHDAGGVKPGH